jgi:hypothetical protein
MAGVVGGMSDTRQILRNELDGILPLSDMFELMSFAEGDGPIRFETVVIDAEKITFLPFDSGDECGLPGTFPHVYVLDSPSRATRISHLLETSFLDRDETIEVIQASDFEALRETRPALDVHENSPIFPGVNTVFDELLSLSARLRLFFSHNFRLNA